MQKAVLIAPPPPDRAVAREMQSGTPSLSLETSPLTVAAAGLPALAAARTLAARVPVAKGVLP